YISRLNQANVAWQVGQVDRVRKLLQDSVPQRTGGYDFRGFEWHYLNRLCHSDVATIAGRQQLIRSVAYHPDGKRIAFAWGNPAWGHTVRRSTRGITVWDTTRGKEVLNLQVHQALFTQVTFSPDGKYLAGVAGKVIIIWETASGKEIATFPGQIC